MNYRDFLDKTKLELSQNILSDGPLRYVLAHRSYGEGLVVELGTGEGNVTRLIARNIGKNTLHTFDSFWGSPRDWRPGFKKGTGSRNGAVPENLPKNVVVHTGLFEETLPFFAEEQKDKQIALLFVDCDLYSSTKTALTALAPLLRNGSLVIFDEFYNYPGWEDHEAKAFYEFIQEFEKEYQAFGTFGSPYLFETRGARKGDWAFQKAAFLIFDKGSLSTREVLAVEQSSTVEQASTTEQTSADESTTGKKSSKKSKRSKKAKVVAPPVRFSQQSFETKTDIKRDDFNVRLIVTYGRRQYFECLLPYIIRELDQFTDVWIWQNTKVPDDIKFLEEALGKINSPKISIIQPEKPTGKRDGVYPLYKKCTDERTLYIKIDDDVVWVEKDAFKNLIDFALSNKDDNSVFSANVVNSGPLDAKHQIEGASVKGPVVISNINPYKALMTVEGATQVHQSLQESIKNNTTDQYHTNMVFLGNERWSINCIAFMGNLFNAADHKRLAIDDEKYITKKLSSVKNKNNVVSPNSLMAHFSFEKQRVKRRLLRGKKATKFDENGTLLANYLDLAHAELNLLQSN